ncbi:MAG TPA: hypothetical protein VIP11_02745 [Gemmatimonadaceae bacterium]
MSDEPDPVDGVARAWAAKLQAQLSLQSGKSSKADAIAELRRIAQSLEGELAEIERRSADLAREVADFERQLMDAVREGNHYTMRRLEGAQHELAEAKMQLNADAKATRVFLAECREALRAAVVDHDASPFHPDRPS